MAAVFQGYTPSNTGGAPGGAGGVTVEDEGTPLATLADTLDFVGAGVTASGAGAEKTITIPGGGAGDVTKVGTPANDELAVWTGDGTLEGSANFDVVGTQFRSALGNGPAIVNEVASTTNPTLIPRQGDLDTGITNVGDDRLGLVAGGTLGMQLVAAAGGIVHGFDVVVGITAFAGGGIGSAVQLNQSYNVVATVATTGDSVKLPLINHVGGLIYIKNDGANALDVFPAVGDDLGQGTSVALSVAAGASVAFMHTVANTTWTQIVFEVAAAGVSFPLLAPDGTVGAPSYSFTNDPDTGFYRTSSGAWIFSSNGANHWQLSDTAMGVSGVDGAFLLHQAPTATVPSFVPRTTDLDTGIGSNAVDQLSLIAGGVEMARFVEAVGIEQTLILQNDNTGLPDLAALGDPDTGFSWDAANGSYWMGGGSRAWNFSTAKFNSQFSNGPGLMNEVSSATNPTVVPDHADSDTGLGATGSDVLTIVAGGVEGLRVSEVLAAITVQAAGNFQMSNTSGPQLLNAAGTTTVPNLLPSRADPNTGFSAPGADTLNIIAGSVLAMSLVESGGGITATIKGPTTFEGNVLMQAAAGPRLVNTSAGINTPTVIPDQADLDTGIGTNGDDTLSLIAGGKDILQLKTGLNQDQVLAGESGTAGLPFYSFFGDEDSGFWRTGANSIGVALNGANQFSFAVGSFAAQISGGPAIFGELASSTNPTLCPNKADDDTGIGYNSSDILSLIAGGAEIVQLKEDGAGNNQLIIPQVGNNPAVPSLAWGDGDTGFFENPDDTLNIALGGVQKWFLAGDLFGSLVGTGAGIRNEAASAVNPTVNANRTDADTGLGSAAADQLDLIAGGLSCMSVRETAAARQIGFYTTAPISQQTGVAVSAAGIHAALVALGLFTA